MLKSGLDRLRQEPAARYLARRYRLRWDQPDLRDLARPLGERSPSKRRVLIGSIGGHLAGTRLESALAVALRVRDVEVDVLLCDQDLPACLECEVVRIGGTQELLTHGPTRRMCPGCFDSGDRLFTGLNAKVFRYGDFLVPEQRREAAELARETPIEDVPGYRLDGVAVGEHALAGALRFFARATIDDEPGADAVLRRYFEAAVLTVRVAQGAFDRTDYVAAVFHHGIYVPQGLLGEVARRRGVRVVTWNPAYRSQTFVFSHGDTYHHTLMHEPTDDWENIAWTSELESELLDYLKSRWTGAHDWIVFHQEPKQELAAIEEEIGVDFSKPCIGLLTNVMWDAQLHYPANAFPNMRDWCLETIRYFAARPELQLLIRVHPAELRGGIPSRQPIVDEIRSVFAELPPNVFLVGPESSISTYVAMMQCNAIVIYGTKTGVELAAVGKPVVVAGEAWVRNKGFTLDAESREHYFSILDGLPQLSGMSPEHLERARKYAYHFFFRRMIPLEMMAPARGKPPYDVRIASLEELRPGYSVGLDVVCDGILKGSEFIYPAEHCAAQAPATVPLGAAETHE